MSHVVSDGASRTAAMTEDELRAALAEERARTAALYREIDARDRLIASTWHGGSEKPEVARLKEEVRALHESTSWRITEPLRRLKTEWTSWRRGLPRSPVPSLPIPVAAGKPSEPRGVEHRGRRKIMVVDVRIPAPDIQSSGVRMAAILDLLREFGFDITFVSNHAPEDYHRVFGKVEEQLRARVARLNAQEVSVIFGYAAARAHLMSAGEQYDVALVSLPDLMLQYAPAIRYYAPRATLIYDTVDLHELRLSRAAWLSGDPGKFSQADRYGRVEAANIETADRIVAITDEEARWIARHHPAARVFTIPNIHEIRHTVPRFDAREGLLFIGHYLHAPNEDAAAYLARDILPILRGTLGNVPLYLLGSSPTPDVKGLNGNGVHVVGHVENASEYFDRCRVFVAPLRFGAGMKGKIGQSMSLGLPVVTTPVGAEGMHLTNGETVLIAEQPQDFAAAIVRLYRDETLWNDISGNALHHVSSRFSLSVARAALKELVCA
jgi:glycosyltransferase involved in cell wall biosynthesis